MIFSLSTEPISFKIEFPSENLDCFVFFSYSGSIDLSLRPEHFLLSIMSSLRMKKDILLIDKCVSPDEKFIFNRGLRAYEGDGYIYLAAHSLSLLRPFQAKDVSNFHDLRSLLIVSKLLKTLEN